MWIATFCDYFVHVSSIASTNKLDRNRKRQTHPTHWREKKENNDVRVASRFRSCLSPVWTLLRIPDLSFVWGWFGFSVVIRLCGFSLFGVFLQHLKLIFLHHLLYTGISRPIWVTVRVTLRIPSVLLLERYKNSNNIHSNNLDIWFKSYFFRIFLISL